MFAVLGLISTLLSMKQSLPQQTNELAILQFKTTMEESVHCTQNHFGHLLWEYVCTMMLVIYLEFGLQVLDPCLRSFA